MSACLGNLRNCLDKPKGDIEINYLKYLVFSVVSNAWAHSYKENDEENKYIRQEYYYIN